MTPNVFWGRALDNVSRPWLVLRLGLRWSLVLGCLRLSFAVVVSCVVELVVPLVRAVRVGWVPPVADPCLDRSSRILTQSRSPVPSRT